MFDLFNTETLQSSKTLPSSLILKRNSKRKMINALKKEFLQDVLKEIENGYSYHIISNGKFDYWTFIPVILELIGGKSDHFYASTWTLNRGNCLEMFELFDKGAISELNFLTGLYFKQREAAVYATLLEGIIERGQRYKCLENHAKVTLLSNGEKFITVEGSANFTANPRIEQYIISEGKDLFDFHKSWFDSILDSK